MISLRNPKKNVLLAVLTAAISVNAPAAQVVRCLTEAVADVEMTSTVPGTVSAILHGEGSFVEKGSVIVELEAKSEQLNIQRLDVQVKNLKATMERSEMLLKNTSSKPLNIILSGIFPYTIIITPVCSSSKFWIN